METLQMFPITQIISLDHTATSTFTNTFKTSTMASAFSVLFSHKNRNSNNQALDPVMKNSSFLCSKQDVIIPKWRISCTTHTSPDHISIPPLTHQLSPVIPASDCHRLFSWGQTSARWSSFLYNSHYISWWYRQTVINRVLILYIQ